MGELTFHQLWHLSDLRADNGPDGKSCVDAAVAAGQRSRAIIFIILLLMVFTLTSIRNNYDPAWDYTLIQIYEDLHDCLVQNNLEDPRCSPLKDRIEDLMGRPPRKDDVVTFAEDAQIDLNGDFGAADFGSLNATKIKELETRYNALIAKDATSEAISIPLLSSFVDYNDLWLVSGIIMFCLLFALNASFGQELRNGKYIFERKPLYADLLIMNQLITLQSASRSAVRVLQAIVWLLPTYLYLYLFYTDLDTYDLSVIMVGQSRSLLEYSLEGATVIGVVIANILCFRTQLVLRTLFDRRAAS